MLHSTPPPSVSSPNVKPTPLVIFGEMLYDCFPDGRRVLGGAPFNVAWGLRGLGLDPMLISAVGNDEDGREIRRRMEKWGMQTQALQTNADHLTGDVQVTLQNDEPAYEISAPRAWDFIQDEGHAASQLLYHGLLALRSEVTADTFKAIQARSSAKRFFDINLRPPHYNLDVLKQWIHGVNWLKLNIDELAQILGEDEITFVGCEPRVELLREQYEIENVLLTAGSQGAMIRGSFGNAACSPAPTLEKLVDTVGAGDSFSAVTIHGILTNLPADEIVKKAGLFAAKVCGMSGAISEDKAFYL